VLDNLILWIVHTVDQWGYAGIFAGMFLESSFFPFPSEVIMIPAGYLAYQGKMSLTLAILTGILGSAAGSLFNYYLSARLGRPFLLKYGKYLLIKPDTLEKMDLFFSRHGEISTFSGRLIPGVRQYISLPAGLSGMPVGRFILFTALGAGIWTVVLTLLGYLLGQHQELVSQYLHNATLIAIIAVSGLIFFYWLRYRAKKGDV
jgi:membrane protein DedA with SNARE-associated domain